MYKILVVNNDLDTMGLLKTLLERNTTYKVEFTSNKDLVCEIVASFNPDLLLVDVLQKEVVGILRLNPAYAALPVILMTGCSLRDSSIEYDADDVIEKPFAWDLLENKIHGQLQKLVE
jgi:DNA-binding response OmpR family regulator